MCVSGVWFLASYEQKKNPRHSCQFLSFVSRQFLFRAKPFVCFQEKLICSNFYEIIWIVWLLCQFTDVDAKWIRTHRSTQTEYLHVSTSTTVAIMTLNVKRLRCVWKDVMKWKTWLLGIFRGNFIVMERSTSLNSYCVHRSSSGFCKIDLQPLLITFLLCYFKWKIDIVNCWNRTFH